MKTLLKMIVPAVSTAVVFAGGSAYAHHATAGSGIGKAGPVTTISASTLKKGSYSIEMLAEFQKFNQYSGDELLELAESGAEDVHNTDYLFSPSVGIAYGFTDDLTFHIRVPYVSKNNISSVHHHEEEDEYEIEEHGDAKGRGDMILFGHYRFLNRAVVRASFLAGLKVPTGDRSVRTVDGELFEAEFQPGSGSWDVLAGIAVSKPVGDFSLDANVLYTFTSEGTQNANLGDVFNYNVSVAYRSLKRPLNLDLILEANGMWRQREKVDEKKSRNSGGETILISPGARAGMGDRVMIYFNVGIPVMQDLNGEQNELDYRTIWGINVLL